jgi:hypothetical protein
MKCGTHAFSSVDVAARIAHSLGLKEDITIHRKLPLVRHSNSIAVLFTHMSDQSTRRTLWVPLVTFLFGEVHKTFCPESTHVTPELHMILPTVLLVQVQYG